MAAYSSTGASDSIQRLFFETFETRAGMTLSPNFGVSDDKFFGLFGGSVSDFGSGSRSTVQTYLGTSFD
jgi:hypothetical protein